MRNRTFCLGISIRECHQISCYNIGDMSRSSGIRLIAWIVLVILNGDVASGQVGPNSAVKINDSTVSNCTVSSMASTLWTRTTDGNSNTLLIASACIVSGDNAAHYSTEIIGTNICRQTIGNATMQMGGVYTCFDGSSTSYRSLVTVFDPVASVVVYNQSEVVEGDELTIMCNITYNGPISPAPSLRPSPYWITSPEQKYRSNIFYTSADIVTLQAVITVQKPIVPIFKCNTSFEITGSTTGYNLTAPADDLRVGATSKLDVQYVPSTPSVTGTPAVITNNGVPCGVTVLTCKSTSNPTPNYRWYDSADLNVTLSTNDTLTDGEINRNYKCEAYNTIRNVMNIASTTYTVSRVDCTSTVECCGPAPSDPWWVFFPVYFGACWVLGFLFLGYYNLSGHKVDYNTQFSWLPKMLPCMNKGSSVEVFWIILFLVMVTFVGIFAIPYIFFKVMCCRSKITVGQMDQLSE